MSGRQASVSLPLVLQKFSAWRERRKREQRQSDEELRKEQEAAEERMGIDPDEFDVELKQAEAAPWHRGMLGWGARRREVKEAESAPQDEKPG